MGMAMISTAIETISQIQKASKERPDVFQVRIQTSRLQETLIVIERAIVLSAEGNFFVASALAENRP